MRTLIGSVFGAVALVIGAAGMASGADLKAPITKAPPPVAIYNWTGFYVGAHVGGAWGPKDWSDPEGFVSLPGTPMGSHDVSGAIAGGQVGFNWQAPGSNWVLGVEGQMSWADLNGDHIFDEDLLSKTKVRWLATVAGRLGYAWDRVLLYAKGGVAFVRDKHQFADLDDGVVDPTFNFTGDKTRTGWMVGGGIEFALGGNWSAKAEYNYMDFGNKAVTFTGVPPTTNGPFRFDIDQQIHAAKFGINYRFGGPLARY
jgi:outer membrane immunogenic protein